MSIKAINTSNPAFKTSLNQILSWFAEDAKKDPSVHTLFNEQGWFHRCVDIRGKAIQNMPWVITRPGSDDPVFDCDSPTVPDELAFASDLPNLLYLWEASLSTVKQMYTLKESEGVSVDNLFYFNPMKVKPVKTAESGIVAYERQINGQKEVYAAEDMIALFHPDPFIENGASPHNAGKKNAQILRALEGFLDSFLSKGLVKATILSVENAEHYQEEEKNKLLSKWKKLMTGWFNSGEHGVFNAQVKPITVGEGLGDLNDKELNKDQREAIAAYFGVPLSLLMSNAANFATAQVDVVNFFLFTMIPEAKFMMRGLNEQLFTPLDYEFKFEWNKLEAIQAHELDKAAKVVAVVGGPVLTQDEGRALLGYDALGTEEVVIDAREPEETPRQIEASGDGNEDEDMKVLVEEIVDKFLAERKSKEVEADFAVVGDGSQEGFVTLPVINGGLTSREVDIKNWQKKIKKKGRQVKFEPNHLTKFEAAVIRERLDDPEMPMDDVFKEPFINF